MARYLAFNIMVREKEKHHAKMETEAPYEEDYNDAVTLERLYEEAFSVPQVDNKFRKYKLDYV